MKKLRKYLVALNVTFFTASLWFSFRDERELALQLLYLTLIGWASEKILSCFVGDEFNLFPMLKVPPDANRAVRVLAIVPFILIVITGIVVLVAPDMFSDTGN